MKILHLLIILLLSAAILFSCMTSNDTEEPASKTVSMLPECNVQEAYALYAGCINRDGNTIFLSGRHRTSLNDVVFIIDLKSLSVEKRLQADEDSIYTIALSPNEQQLATGSSSHRLRIWDTESWEQILEIKSTETITSTVFDHRGWSLFFNGPDNIPYEQLSFYPALDAKPLIYDEAIVFGSIIYILASNPVDGHLATGGKYGKLRYLQTSESNEDNKVLWTNDDSDGDILALTYNNSGELLFSAGTSGTVDVFNCSTGTRIHSLDTNSDSLNWLTTDIRNSRLYGASTSGTIYVWDLETYELVSNIKTHNDQVQTIFADPLNRFIISAGFSNKIIFHNPETFQTIAEIYLFEDALVAVTPEGFYTGEGNYKKYVNSGTENRENVINSIK